MTPSPGWQFDRRNSRRVRHAQLRVNPGAPRHRLAAVMEEALRLAVLPGENEGRAYYIQSIRLAGLPADGDRRTWLIRFQTALSEAAASAVHGSDSRADLAPAVFFRSRQEALEILLHRVLERRTAREWYWPMVTRDANGAGSTSQATPSSVRNIPAIVEALRSTPAEWSAVAAALFAIPRIDAVRLLQAIPETLAAFWVQDMDGGQPVPPQVNLRISMPAQRALLEALHAFGFEDPRTIWFAALAILRETPSELAAGTLIERSRAALRNLVAESYAPRRDATTPARGEQRPLEIEAHIDSHHCGAGLPACAGAVPNSRRQFEDATPVSHPEATIPSLPALNVTATSHTLSDAAAPSVAPSESVASGRSSTPLPESLTLPDVPPSVPSPQVSHPAAPDPAYADGLPTRAAGLFFLLNALTRLGIAEAVASGLTQAYPDFLTRLFQRFAEHAGVTPEDPIPAWLASLSSTDTDDRSPSVFSADWSPRADLPLYGAATPPLEYLLRVWVLAVRRWCWRLGQITVREIIARPGVFTVNRTDLDVSLALDDADVRIRGIGLDLDPGWLPWFGRVVRFHYHYRRGIHG